jgi:aryl-alcohol dehydrogenase-like predicted oxidoreductase
VRVHRIGGTALETSEVILGTMTFGAQLDEAASARAVDAALEAGVTHFDCANSYSEGVAERVLGRALGRRRGDVILSTKAFNPVLGVRGLDRRSITRALDDSLARLGTDYVDLFYLHQPDRSTPIEETLSALDQLVLQGKVRYPAMSNYAAWQMAQARAVQDARGFAPVHVAQMMYNVITRDLDAEYAEFARTHGVSTFVYNPLAGGLLTGKYAGTDDAVAPGTRFSGSQYRERYWSERQFEAAARVGDLAASLGLTSVELSLAWVAAQPLVDGVIIGGSSVEQLTANLDALARTTLDPDTLEQCDSVWNDLRGPLPHYNR